MIQSVEKKTLRVPVSMRLNDDEYEWLLAQCKQADVPMTEGIRQLIREAMSKQPTWPNGNGTGIGNGPLGDA